MMIRGTASHPVTELKSFYSFLIAFYAREFLGEKMDIPGGGS
jgi:hypothetical protein